MKSRNRSAARIRIKDSAGKGKIVDNSPAVISTTDGTGGHRAESCPERYVSERMSEF